MVCVRVLLEVLDLVPIPVRYFWYDIVGTVNEDSLSKGGNQEPVPVENWSFV